MDQKPIIKKRRRAECGSSTPITAGANTGGMMIIKVIIDKEKCIGCTLCVQACPEVFKMEGDKAVVNANPPPREAEDSCRDAAQQCPVEAITIQ